MKLAILLGCVALAAAQLPTFNTDIANGVAYMGYPNVVSVDKAGGSFSGNLNIDSLSFTASTYATYGYQMCAIIMVQYKSTNSDAKTDVYAHAFLGAGNPPVALPAPYSPPDPGAYGIMTQITANSGATQMYGLPIYVNNTKIAIGGNVGKCSSCLKTTDLLVSALPAFCKGSTSASCCTQTSQSNYDDYNYWFVSPIGRDNINTWTFKTSGVSTTDGTGYQDQPRGLLLPTSMVMSNPVYLLATPNLGSPGGSMWITFKADSDDVGSSSTWPAPTSITSQTPGGGPILIPFAASASTGSFRSGPVSFSSGTNWYVVPYVPGGSGSAATSTWTLAVGYGHQPASAGTVVPSLLLAAALAVAAMLF